MISIASQADDENPGFQRSSSNKSENFTDEECRGTMPTDARTHQGKHLACLAVVSLETDIELCGRESTNRGFG